MAVADLLKPELDGDILLLQELEPNFFHRDFNPAASSLLAQYNILYPCIFGKVGSGILIRRNGRVSIEQYLCADCVEQRPGSKDSKVATVVRGLRAPAEKLTVVSTHFATDTFHNPGDIARPASDSYLDTRRSHAVAIAKTLRTKDADALWVLGGDLNAQAGPLLSEIDVIFDDIGMLRLPMDPSLRTALLPNHKDEAIYDRFYVSRLFFAFRKPNIVVPSTVRQIGSPYDKDTGKIQRASDHLPIVAEFSMLSLWDAMGTDRRLQAIQDKVKERDFTEAGQVWANRDLEHWKDFPIRHPGRWFGTKTVGDFISLFKKLGDSD